MSVPRWRRSNDPGHIAYWGSRGLEEGEGAREDQSDLALRTDALQRERTPHIVPKKPPRCDFFSRFAGGDGGLPHSNPGPCLRREFVMRIRARRGKPDLAGVQGTHMATELREVNQVWESIGGGPHTCYRSHFINDDNFSRSC